MADMRCGIMNGVKIYNGDCAEILHLLDSEEIDLTVTSPPYDNLRTYNGNISQWSFDKFKIIAKELYRVTKQGGIVVWIVNDATIKGTETGTSFRQALWFMDCGFNLHDTMIWKKPTFTATGSLKCRYAPVFEYMFVFSKGKVKTFHPIKDKPNKNAGMKHKASTIRTSNGFRKMSGDKIISEFGQRENVWSISPCNSTRERTGHPAQFPEQLAQDHIISWSNEGDTVLDPFMGSGTTGVACIKTGRKFIGIEIDEDYTFLSYQRIRDILEAKWHD
jgi:site-specific DNA-methyltransferase (adenine-specific)